MPTRSIAELREDRGMIMEIMASDIFEACQSLGVLETVNKDLEDLTNNVVTTVIKAPHSL